MRTKAFARIAAAVFTVGALTASALTGEGGSESPAGLPATTPAAATLASSVSTSPSTLPSIIGPLKTKQKSYPFNAVTHNRTPRQLATVGYEEQEFLVSGTSDVYELAPDRSLITAAKGPYTTRIIVRRPISPTMFSGRVVVEMLNPTSLHDLDIVWAATQDQLIRDGDTWIGVTVKPSSITALKKFDADRYASLSMANPRPPACESPTWSGAEPATENGLVWDMVSQIGALAKSNDLTSPLRGLQVKHAYLTGYSQTGGYEVTYVNSIAPNATLANGQPIYDGFLINSGSGFPVPINQCAPAPVPGSPGFTVETPGDVPVIATQTMSDFYALNGFSSRRGDSTGSAGNYRLYEIAGAAHVWAEQVAYAPNGDELVKSGFPATWWDPYCDQDVTSFPLQYALDGALVNLYRWAERGIPAPTAARITVSDPTSADAVTSVDQYGNALGGLRTPAVDVPTATYYGTTPGTGTCTVLWGHEQPFTSDELTSLYPNHETYVSKVSSSVDSLVAEGWLTAADGRSIVAAARRDHSEAPGSAPVVPTSKDQCKKSGWKTFNDPSFKNQGDCVSYIASGGKKAIKG